MSLMYTRKSKGPRTEPWGTPNSMLHFSEKVSWKSVYCIRFDIGVTLAIFSMPGKVPPLRMRIPSTGNVEIGRLVNKMKSQSTSQTVNTRNEDVKAGNPTLGG